MLSVHVAFHHDYFPRTGGESELCPVPVGFVVRKSEFHFDIKYDNGGDSSTLWSGTHPLAIVPL